MKRLIAFYQIVLQECGTRCGISTTLDCKTIESRLKDEGFEFLTLTLPTFCKGFERSLTDGCSKASHYPGFAAGCSPFYPAFLQGFMGLIFHAETGSLLDGPSIAAVQCIRQLCLIYKKVNIPCSRERVDAAYKRYIQCEREVQEADEIYNGSSLQEDFIAASAIVFLDLFCAVENDIYSDRVIPKHSSGSTADRLLGNGKYYQKTWPERLQRVIPWDSALLPSPSFASEAFDVVIAEPGAELPVKVIDVPKSQKTPRIIAMEPTCMQYVQQGILSLIVENGRKNKFFRSFCQTWDQNSNQILAQEGSQYGTFATLDLSEASDRVSFQHVIDLLTRHPLLLEYVSACRSLKAEVPGFGVIRLAKFASMGSALCFPFEAMIFTVICLMGCAKARGTSMSKSFVNQMIGQVRVYGDDIIVPSDCAEEVIGYLEAFGYRVNTDKSFWTGLFRESCGKEYFKGHDVSVVKVNELFPHNFLDANELISTVSLHNQLFLAAMHDSADYLKIYLSRFQLGEVYPHSLHTAILGFQPDKLVSSIGSVLALFSYVPNNIIRNDKNLHKPLIKTCKVVGRSPINSVNDEQALMKFFLERGAFEPLPKNAYQRSGRPRSVYIKAGYFDPR